MEFRTNRNWFLLGLFSFSKFNKFNRNNINLLGFTDHDLGVIRYFHVFT